MKKLISLILVFALFSTTVVYGMSVEDVGKVVSQLETLRVEEGRVSKTLIREMASALLELEVEVREKGIVDSAEVYALIERAEGTLESVPMSYVEVQDAHSAIAKIKDTLKGSGDTYVVEEETAKAGVAASTIKDIGNHWGKGYITQLIDRGGITGYTDGTFRPDNTITTAEFMTIAVRSALNGNVAESNGGHWASGIFESARQEGVLLLNDFPQSTWDKPINRYDMAYILVRVTENIKDEEAVSTSGVANIMSDNKAVSGTRYQHYVEQAFMKGLITGKTKDGKFDGVANGTRAEAATMVVRMLEETNRVEVDTTKVERGKAVAQKHFEAIPDYQTRTNHGLQFAGVGYTLDDVAVFSQEFLQGFLNYDATNKASMDEWESTASNYLTTGQADEYLTVLKQQLLDKNDTCEATVFVDASKIEIKDGNFIVHGTYYDAVTGKSVKLKLIIGGHNVNKGNLAIGGWWFEVLN